MSEIGIPVLFVLGPIVVVVVFSLLGFALFVGGLFAHIDARR